MIYLLSDKKIDGVVNIPLLDTVFLRPNIDLSKYNSLIFTSKKAVQAMESLELPWRQKHIFTIGEATTDFVKSLGASVYYQSNTGYGEEFAKEIIKKYPFGKYLHCRAKEVATDLTAILKKSGIFIDSAIVYKTECQKTSNETIEKNSVIIFTSPKIADCFFKFYKWNESLKAVCIGKTTKKAMPKDIEVFLPQEATIKSALELSKELQD